MGEVAMATAQWPTFDCRPPNKPIPLHFQELSRTPVYSPTDPSTGGVAGRPQSTSLAAHTPGSRSRKWLGTTGDLNH